MRPRLRIPTRLAVTVTAVACASPAPIADGGADASEVASDGTTRDARPEVLSDAPGDVAVDTPADLPVDVAAMDARECTRDPFDPESRAFAVQCRARRGATSPCPEARVCVAEDCPAQCAGCLSPLFCIPDNEVDAGVDCVVGTVCRVEDCNPGCRAVG